MPINIPFTFVCAAQSLLNYVASEEAAADDVATMTATAVCCANDDIGETGRKCACHNTVAHLIGILIGYKRRRKQKAVPALIRTKVQIPFFVRSISYTSMTSSTKVLSSVGSSESTPREGNVYSLFMLIPFV